MKKTRRIKALWSIILVAVMIIIMSNNVLSAAPFQLSNNELQIEYPKYDTIKLNDNHKFHVHVINSTTAKTNLTTSCIINLNNQTGFESSPTSPVMIYESSGKGFSYTFNKNNFSTIGVYSFIIQCNSSNEVGFASGQLLVTPNGLERPIGITVVFFSLALLILFGFLIFITFYSIGHIVSLDFDLKDMSINWGMLFATYALLFLSQNYLGNLDYDKFLETILGIMIWTNGILPLIGFVLSITVGVMLRNAEAKKQQYE